MDKFTKLLSAGISLIGRILTAEIEEDDDANEPSYQVKYEYRHRG